MVRRKKKDIYTIDMFNEYEPPKVKVTIPTDRLFGASLDTEISKTIAMVLEDCPMDRADIATKMSEYLGTEITKNILNNYASPSQDHNINFGRLCALVFVTGDPRPMVSILGKIGFSIIDEKYTAAVEEAIIAEQIEDLNARKKTARMKWKN